MIDKWLYSIRPPKFLRYLFFVAYSFYRRFITERGNAHLKTGLFIGMIHSIMYASLFMWITKMYDKLYMILIILFAFIQIYFWFWYKQKWKVFIEEFKYVNRNQQLLAGIYLFIYLFISLMCLFLPILLDEVFGIRIVSKLK